MFSNTLVTSRFIDSFFCLVQAFILKREDVSKDISCGSESMKSGRVCAKAEVELNEPIKKKKRLNFK